MHIDHSKEKNKEWYLSVARNAWMTNSGKNLYTEKYHDFVDNRKYLESLQGTERYFSKFGLHKNESEQYVDFNDLNWTPIGVLRKMAKRVKGHLLKSRVNIVATAIDDKSIAEKDDLKVLMEVLDEVGPQMQSAGIPVDGMKKQLGLEPDESGVNLIEEVGMKNAYELAIEYALKVVDNDIAFDRGVFPSLLDDILATGMICIEREYDKSGRILKKSIPPEQAIFPYSRHLDFRDADYKGYWDEISFKEFRESNINLTDDEVLELFKKQSGFLTDLSRGSTYRQYDDDHKIVVLYMDVHSIEMKEKEMRKIKKGEGNIIYNDYAGKKKKKIEYSVPQIYTMAWVVGTEEFLYYGRKANLTKDGTEVKSDFTFCKISPSRDWRSYVGHLKPIEDVLQTGWVKLQNALASSTPSGTAYDIKAIQNAIDMGIKADNIMDVIAGHKQTGDLPFARTNDWQEGNSGNPVYPLMGGAGKEFAEYVELIKFCMFLMKEITGSNSVVEGGNAQPNMLKGVAEMVLQGNNEVLSELVNVVQLFLEEDAHGTSLMLNFAINNGAYKHSLSKDVLDIFKDTKEFSSRRMAIKLEDRMPEGEIAELKAAIDQLVISRRQTGKGGINEYVYLKLRNLVSEDPKYAQYFLFHEVKKQEEKDRAAEKENMAMQGQLNQQSAEAKGKQEKEKEALKVQGDIQKIEKKGEVDERLLEKEHLLED